MNTLIDLIDDPVALSGLSFLGGTVKNIRKIFNFLGRKIYAYNLDGLESSSVLLVEERGSINICDAITEQKFKEFSENCELLDRIGHDGLKTPLEFPGGLSLQEYSEIMQLFEDKKISMISFSTAGKQYCGEGYLLSLVNGNILYSVLFKNEQGLTRYAIIDPNESEPIYIGNKLTNSDKHKITYEFNKKYNSPSIFKNPINWTKQNPIKALVLAFGAGFLAYHLGKKLYHYFSEQDSSPNNEPTKNHPIIDAEYDINLANVDIVSEEDAESVSFPSSDDEEIDNNFGNLNFSKISSSKVESSDSSSEEDYISKHRRGKKLEKPETNSVLKQSIFNKKCNTSTYKQPKELEISFKDLRQIHNYPTS